MEWIEQIPKLRTLKIWRALFLGWETSLEVTVFKQLIYVALKKICSFLLFVMRNYYDLTQKIVLKFCSQEPNKLSTFEIEYFNFNHALLEKKHKNLRFRILWRKIFKYLSESLLMCSCQNPITWPNSWRTVP